MKSAVLDNGVSFSNILYIGDEPKTCLSIIEEFNNRLLKIEHMHEQWFSGRHPKNRVSGQDKLQHYIHYHFEGGIAIFKFKNEEDLPVDIRIECLDACKCLIEEQIYWTS